MGTRYSATLFTLLFWLNGLRYSNAQKATLELIVNVSQGVLQGHVINNVRGREYYAFRGIPYARPALDQLRFKAPQPPDSWIGVRDASVQGPQCLQGPVSISGSEDCLYLNVYTPEPPANMMNNLRSVMVWIHGGTFSQGSGGTEEFGPDHLVNENVIVVTINYRLGVLGFLSIDDPNLDVPGNAGLKDQVMALRWVQENIINFGGNPNDVTLFGGNAGGASVHLLVLSPLAQGLFHRAIIQSPLSLEKLVYRERNCSLELLMLLSIDETDNARALQLLRKLPANDLVEVQLAIDDLTFDRPKCFIPTIERASQETAILSDHPFNIIRSGNYAKIPLIFGFNSREGMLMWNDLEMLLLGTVEDFVPYQLGLPVGSSESQRIAEEMKNFYFGGNELSSEAANELVLFFSDTFFAHGVHRSVVEHLRNIGHNMFLYRFSVDGRLNSMKFSNNINAPGAAHSDELGYLFVNQMLPVQVIPNSVEDLTIQRMAKLWTNFAKFSNPNPQEASDLINVKWQPVEENQLHFLEIGENLAVGVNPDHVRMQFWDRVLKY